MTFLIRNVTKACRSFSHHTLSAYLLTLGEILPKYFLKTVQITSQIAQMVLQQKTFEIETKPYTVDL